MILTEKYLTITATKIYIIYKKKSQTDMKIQKIQDSQHNFKTAFFGGNST